MSEGYTGTLYYLHNFCKSKSLLYFKSCLEKKFGSTMLKEILNYLFSL